MASTARMETDKRKLKYSNMETRLLELLAKGGPVTSEELVERYYDGNQPFAARHSVTSVMRTLIRKIEHNEENFIITKSAPSGPYPAQYQKLRKLVKQG